MRDPDVQRLAPAPVPADVGIVMALPIEAGYLTDSLKKVRKYSARSHTVVEGELAGKVVAVILAGVGRKAARAGAEVLIAGHRPRWLFSAGFAGALDPSLARNDLVRPRPGDRPRQRADRGRVAGARSCPESNGSGDASSRSIG